LFVLSNKGSYIKLIFSFYLDDVDTLDDVDIEDDVETELDVDALENNGRSLLYIPEMTF